MLLSNINSNNTSVIHLDVSEVKIVTDSDHDDSVGDNLEAEISKLEATIRDLETDNNFPDIDSCAYELEEDEILNPAIYNSDDASNTILNTVSHKEQDEPNKKMLLSNINSNNTSVIHLDVSEVKIVTDSDHDDSVGDNLEAEISKLEATIRDLETDNDFPDIDSCAYELEEDEILNPVIYNSDDASNTILNTVSHKEEDEPNTSITLEGILEPSETLEVSDLRYSSEPRTASFQKSSVEHQKFERSIKADVTLLQELKIHNEDMTNSIKSVIISNNCDEVSLRSQDCELSTNDAMVHLNSVNKSGMEFSCTTHHGTNAEKNKTCSLLMNKNSNSAVARNSSFENGNDNVPQESHLQVDASEFEDELSYPEDAEVDDSNDVTCRSDVIEDSEPMISSTPLRIKTGTLKRWKPVFLRCEESFLVLDEFGESSDQDGSLCSYINSSVQNMSIESVAATHSTEPTCFTHNSLFLKVKEDSSIDDVNVKGSNNMKQIKVALDDARDQKIVVKVGDEAIDDCLRLSSCAGPLPVLANATPVQGHGIQEIVPVMKAKNTDKVNWETRDFESLANLCIDQVNSGSKAVTRTVTDFGGNSTNNIPEGNTLVSSSLSDRVEQNLLDQKQNITSKVNEDYVSNNPQENYDNNNPDWELLRKLETDEERYRAMRQRWRNLTTPNPNQDLTYRNWRIHQKANKLTKSAAQTSNYAIIQQTRASDSGASVSMQDHHKRTLSDEQASIDHQPRMKHSRTQSCTAVYDKKLEQLRKNIQHEKQQIYDQEHAALIRLNMKQTQEMNYLQNFCRTYGNIEQIRWLYYQQKWDVEQVQKKFDEARLAVDRANLSQVQILEKACEEVQAFHKFYQGLDHDSDADALFLSESQLEELWETERLYDQYGKFYSA
ncbi:hypothetical protein B7P43_G15619 [Cryptotermes secundus]|uniref:Uncharacterized protein n=3 Tax=Cryptotermes secundus TaxID=105785 RepID=A0A2J7R299_9NEOP|nr:uncharacterized protein LOC111863828 isoform X2 [Cryptotermes secundus]PNF34963.1 hypothetical protein B7P43_G15619 [Cryptotermes secundus]